MTAIALQYCPRRLAAGLAVLGAFSWLSCSKDPIGPAASSSGVASVVVSPQAATVALGDTIRLTALAKDAVGNMLTGQTVSWASGDAGVATVSVAGLVTGASVGSAIITAVVGGKTGGGTVTVCLRRVFRPLEMPAGQVPERLSCG